MTRDSMDTRALEALLRAGFTIRFTTQAIEHGSGVRVSFEQLYAADAHKIAADAIYRSRIEAR